MLILCIGWVTCGSVGYGCIILNMFEFHANKYYHLIANHETENKDVLNMFMPKFINQKTIIKGFKANHWIEVMQFHFYFFMLILYPYINYDDLPVNMTLIYNKKFLILENFISFFTTPWKLWFKQFLNCIIISNKTNMKNAYKNIPFAWLSWCRPLNAWITDVKISCDRCFNGGYKNQLRDTYNVLFAEIWIYKKK